MKRIIVSLIVVAAGLLWASSASALPTFVIYTSYYDASGNGIGFERDGCLGYNLYGQTSEIAQSTITTGACGDAELITCEDVGLITWDPSYAYYCVTEGYILTYRRGLVTDPEGNYCDPRGYGYSCE